MKTEGSGNGNGSAVAVKAGVVMWSRDPELIDAVIGAAGAANARVDAVRTAREFVRTALPVWQAPDAEPECRVVVVDELVDAQVKAVLEDVLRARPSLKAVCVRNGSAKGATAGAGADVGDEVEWRRIGAYFLVTRPVSADLLAKVLAKAIEHETTRILTARGGAGRAAAAAAVAAPPVKGNGRRNG